MEICPKLLKKAKNNQNRNFGKIFSSFDYEYPNDFFVDSNTYLMWKWYESVRIGNFIILGVTGTQNGPPIGQKMVFWAQKNFWKLFSESLSQNLMFDTKTNFLSFVDPKLWPFKKYWYPKIAKFWNAHNTPPRGPRAKKFWISKFLPRGHLHAKNDQNRWDKGVNLLWSALEWAYFKSTILKKSGV